MTYNKNNIQNENSLVSSKCLQQGKNLNKNKSDRLNKTILVEAFENNNEANQKNMNNDIDYSNLKKLIDNLKLAEKKLDDLQTNIKNTTANYHGKVSNVYVNKPIYSDHNDELNVKTENLGTYLLSDNTGFFIKVPINADQIVNYCINNNHKYYAISDTNECYIHRTDKYDRDLRTLKKAELRTFDPFSDATSNHLLSVNATSRIDTIIVGHNAMVYFCDYSAVSERNVCSSHYCNGAPDPAYWGASQMRTVELLKLLLTKIPERSIKYKIGSGEDDANAYDCLTTYIGCYKDTSSRAIPDYQGESYTVEACHKKAISVKASIFGLQDAGKGATTASNGYGTSQCFTGNSYDDAIKYGTSTNCKQSPPQDDSQFYGGPWTNAVYSAGIGYCQGSSLTLGDDGSFLYKDKHTGHVYTIIDPATDGTEPEYGIDFYVNDQDSTNYRYTLGEGEFLIPAAGDNFVDRKVLYSSNGAYTLCFSNNDKGNLMMWKKTNNTDFIEYYKKLNGIDDSNIIHISALPNYSFSNNLGKMAFKEETGNHNPYPNSMLKSTANDTYTQIDKGGDVSYKPVPENQKTKVHVPTLSEPSHLLNTVTSSNNKNNDFCFDACNKNDKCQGVKIRPGEAGNNNCELIDDRNFIINKLAFGFGVTVDNTDLFVRNPTVDSNVTCPNKATNFIDSIAWGKLSLGNIMTPQTPCSLGKELIPKDSEIKDAQAEVSSAVKALMTKINSLTIEQKQEYDRLGDSMKEVTHLINKYEKYKDNIEEIGGIGKMGTLSAQVEDTHLQLISYNYQYILWTILAIIIIISAMKILRK